MPLHDQLVRRRSRPGARGRSKWPIAIAGLVLLTLVLATVALWKKSNDVRVATDPGTLCPIDRPVAGLTVVLLDISDRFSEPQRIDVENRLQRLRSGLPRFTLIDVYTVDAAGPTVAVPVIHLCSPGKGDDLNEWYQNPSLARKGWDRFADRVALEIQRLLSAPASSTSPIFESIQATALRTFGRPEYDGVAKRLVVVSDLLQNVPTRQSHYAGAPDFESFRRTPYFSEVRADLQSVNVDLYYLHRSDLSLQGAAHVQFWEQFLSAQGARVDSVERIYGDQRGQP